MDVRARKQYLEALLGRYLRARKRLKGLLLDEISRTTGQNRKYIIRKLGGLARAETRASKKRAVVYGRDVVNALAVLWAMFDYPCGQRLRPLIRAELEKLRRLGEVRVAAATAAKLQRISPATIDRLLRVKKGEWKSHARYRPGSPGLIAQKIPLRLGTWTDVQVGRMDMDLVVHCGASLDGEYGHTLSMLETYASWWEAEIVMGRSQLRIFNALKEIRGRCPFDWLSLHSDNDNAFINAMLYDYARENGLGQSRSRPYHKNDNARAEQKNYTHVRRPLGYLRYDTPAELAIITDLYRHELREFKNFFQPVMKLMRKERIGGRVRRVYDEPKTPYQRLLESGQLSPEKTNELREQYLRLNPATLKREIDRKLTKLQDLYQRKKKASIRVNPYKKLEPSMVTFFVSEQPPVRLPV